MAGELGDSDFADSPLDSDAECAAAGIFNLMLDGGFEEEESPQEDPRIDMKLRLYKAPVLLGFWCALKGAFALLELVVLSTCLSVLSSALFGPELLGERADSEADLELPTSSCDLFVCCFDFEYSLEDLTSLALSALFCRMWLLITFFFIVLLSKYWNLLYDAFFVCGKYFSYMTKLSYASSLMNLCPES